jgi:hypothetical protein
MVIKVCQQNPIVTVLMPIILPNGDVSACSVLSQAQHQIKTTHLKNERPR